MGAASLTVEVCDTGNGLHPVRRQRMIFIGLNPF